MVFTPRSTRGRSSNGYSHGMDLDAEVSGLVLVDKSNDGQKSKRPSKRRRVNEVDEMEQCKISRPFIHEPFKTAVPTLAGYGYAQDKEVQLNESISTDLRLPIAGLGGIDLSGIEFNLNESKVSEWQSTYRTRQHRLGGTIGSESLAIGFRMVMDVKEMIADMFGNGKGGAEVIRMETETCGGGTELNSALRSLRLESNPSPAAFFDLLRRFSAQSEKRIQLFQALRAQFPSFTDSSAHSPLSTFHHHATANGGTTTSLDPVATTLLFSNAPRTLVIHLSYTLSVPSTSTSLESNLSLTPFLHPSLRETLSSETIEVLDEIPEEFLVLLNDGLEVESVVSMLVRNVLGDGEQR